MHRHGIGAESIKDDQVKLLLRNRKPDPAVADHDTHRHASFARLRNISEHRLVFGNLFDERIDLEERDLIALHAIRSDGAGAEPDRRDPQRPIAIARDGEDVPERTPRVVVRSRVPGQLRIEKLLAVHRRSVRDPRFC